MADDIRTSDSGAWVITLSALIGFAVAIYNYNAADNGISGTPGAMLVIFSTVALIVAGFILGRDMGGRALHIVLALLALLGILGTGFAAWLLESNMLIALMAISLFGWLVRLFRRRPAYA
jgi:hypothetical protein